jgi:hypothetical protein
MAILLNFKEILEASAMDKKEYLFIFKINVGKQGFVRIFLEIK